MAASIGEQLRLAREARGIGLREICDQTRISLHYLEAIEANDYKRLPGGVFNRSFIKAYAKAIGYDEREAIEGYTRYLREHGESTDDVATTPSYSKVYTDTPATRSPILTVLLAIVILAVLTAAALAALYWFQRRAENKVPVAPQITSRSYRSASSLFFEGYKHIAPTERRKLTTSQSETFGVFLAPEEQNVYSFRLSLFSRSDTSDMNASALRQSHSSMYNDLTPATDDLGLQETDQKALLQ
jgi:cytoskeletal protein RodZ